MKVLIIVDKYGSAIDILSRNIQRYNPHWDITVQSLHPKRPNIDEIENVSRLWDEADIVHVAYWKSGEKFKELYPDKFREKENKILCHYNPYDVDKQNWNNSYKKVVVGNKEIHSKIPYAKLLPYCLDLETFQFNKEYTKDKVVQMVVARIEGKKGVKEVAEACKELGYKFILIGRISKKEYFDQIMAVNPDTDFREDVSKEELIESYKESAVHVCNSIDGFESGTMPILEAMACGVPVLTRNIGHVPDIYDGGNMVVRAGDTNDAEDLKIELKNLMDNLPLREKLREKGWETVKNRPAEKYAREFSSVYYSLLKDKEPLVSIVIPTFDNPESLIDCVVAAVAQDYPHKEIIISDSGTASVEPLVKKFKEETKVPIKYIRFNNNGEYSLAKARNLAIVEAEGEFICFCDERIVMEPHAVTEFVKNDIYKTWLYGVKDGAEKGFVENFSFVNRSLLIAFGMFNERINVYGGMSQEIRNRYSQHGFLFQRIDSARAHSLRKSNSKFNKKADIVKAKHILWKLYE